MYGPTNFWMAEPTFMRRGMSAFVWSDAGIVGSSPTQGTFSVCVCVCVCVFILFLFSLRLGSGLATGWSLTQGVLPSVESDFGTK
jgi:hypothetical protein